MINDHIELIQRILEGDDAAFACLVRKYQKRVHALAWRKIGDFHIAEDITQETFLQVYRKLPTLKNPSQFPGWLYVITNRCCLAWLRKKRIQTQPFEEIDTAMVEKSSYSRHVATEQAESAAEVNRELVKNLLAKLKESDRTIITLYYLSEMTYAEIGEFLGVAADTVRIRVRRVMQRLRKHEPLIREALGSFQLSPTLTENIIREIPRIKPLSPTGGNPPVVPWAIAASTAIFIVIMMGASNQYLARFQQPYSFDSTSEMTVELIKAPVVLDLPSKPDVRNQFGNSDNPGKSNSTGKKLEDILASHFDAIGGLTRLSEIRTVRRSGNAQLTQLNGQPANLPGTVEVAVDQTVPADINDSRDLIGRTQLLMNMIPLILQTDSSRVISVMIQDHLVVPKVEEVSREHHNLSHHGFDPEKIEQLKKIEIGLVKCFNSLLTQLKGKKKPTDRCWTIPRSSSEAISVTPTLTTPRIYRLSSPVVVFSTANTSLTTGITTHRCVTYS